MILTVPFRKFIIILSFFLSCAAPLGAQRFALGTSLSDMASLGTMEMQASLSVQRYITIHAGAGLNPWTFRGGDTARQFEMRSNSYWAGVRYWPWHVYSGWWTSVEGRYMIYNFGGITSRETEEGEAYGGGLQGGYGVMLSEHWNLDLGAGLWGGYKNYRVFACPVCGIKKEEGAKGFILPSARVVLQYIF